MNNISPLLKYEDNWVTSMGAFFPGKRVVLRGKDLLNDFEEFTWMQLTLFAITGKEFDETQAKLFEGIWKYSTSFPEPRIWNNRIASFVGTTKGTGSLAISAAIAVSEARIYGQLPMVRVLDFLLKTSQKIESGELLADIIQSELSSGNYILGYGRPLVSGDERIKPLLTFADSLGFAEGKFVKLAFEIEEFLLSSKYKLSMNVAALDAALAADQGLSVSEFYHFMILSFTAGFFPCYIDANNKPAGSFFPLTCNRISYKGVENQKW